MINREIKMEGSGSYSIITKDLNKLYFYKKDAPKDVLAEIAIDIIPQEVSYDYSANFHEQSVLGRMSPLYVYTGGSDKILSFTVTLHEDVGNIKEKYGSLNGLVVLIKGLSYPSKYNGPLNNVHFQLGSISGEGLVNTSVVWKKPFRDGKYIVADINFNITVVKQFPEVRYTTIVQKVELPDGVHQEYSQIKYTTDEVDSLNFVMNNFGGYDSSYNNFIQVEDTKAVKEFYFNQYKESYEYQATVLNNMYDIIEQRGKGVPKELLDMRRELSLIKWSVTNPAISKTKEEYEKTFDKLQKALIKYIEEDYKSNKDILQSEKDKAIARIKSIFSELKDAMERMTKYGANN